jgi:hypothetical protein
MIPTMIPNSNSDNNTQRRKPKTNPPIIRTSEECTRQRQRWRHDTAMATAMATRWRLPRRICGVYIQLPVLICGEMREYAGLFVRE